jgi:hypothetical protein
MRAINELIRHNRMDSYIHVPYVGEIHKLYEVKEELKRRFNIEEPIKGPEGGNTKCL